MAKNASPQSGDVYLEFNGRDAYAEVPSITDYSVSTTGELTISAWLRPDTLNFPFVERNSDYIYWLGKGEKSGPGGDQEWALRMYNHYDPLDSPSRPNRISFYLFNPQGGLGVGSYVQVPVHKGKWIHIVGVADGSRTYLYTDGQYIRCDTYRGLALGSCEIHYQAPPNQNLQLVINPQAGPAPLRLGTKDLGSFFEGGLTRVRLWNRVLLASEISGLYLADVVPENGLVAEFLLNDDTGTSIVDTAQENNGSLFNASWATQH
jgi:hypothetical protein